MLCHTPVASICVLVTLVLLPLHPGNRWDYNPLRQLLVVLNSCETMKCVPIYIINDRAVERTESFGVTLGRTPDLDSRITLTRVDAVVQIRDDDGNYVNGSQYCYLHNICDTTTHRGCGGSTDHTIPSG